MSKSIGFGALKSILENNLQFSDVIEHGLDENYFEGREKQAYLFIKNFKYNHGVYPQFSTVKAELGDEVDFESLPNEPLEYWAAQLRERKQFRLCHEASKKITESLHNNTTNDTVEILRYYAEQAGKTKNQYAVQDLQDVQSQVLDRHDEIQIEPEISGVPFGFPALDDLTHGNHAGDLNLLVGVTRACKSYVCSRSALSAFESGYNVMYISPEMPGLQIGRRILAMQASLKDSNIRRGALSYYGAEKARSVIDLSKRDNYFKILPSGMFSDVHSLISVCNEYAPDILYIDGIYLLSNKSLRTSSAWQEAESVVSLLKDFSIHANLPIFAVTQYNRAKPGKLEGTKATQSLEFTASNYFSLEFENPEDADISKPIQTRLLKTKKSRDGDIVTIRLKLDFNKMTIEQDSVISGMEYDKPEFQDEEFISEI